MDLENLGKIQRVEAPPFLFTRIQQKIAQAKSETMSFKTALAINLSFAFLLAINLVVLASYQANSNTPEDYAEVFHLSSTNSLYK